MSTAPLLFANSVARNLDAGLRPDGVERRGPPTGHRHVIDDMLALAVGHELSQRKVRASPGPKLNQPCCALQEVIVPLFIMQTQVSADAVHQPRSLQTLERHVSDQIRGHCPGVRWISSYAVLGPCDYIDVFEAPDVESATRVSVLVRSYGRAHSQVWPALAWDDFKKVLQTLPEDASKSRSA